MPKKKQAGTWVISVEKGHCLDYHAKARCSACGWQWFGRDGVGNCENVFSAFVNGPEELAKEFVMDNALGRKLYPFCPMCGAPMAGNSRDTENPQDPF